MTRTRRRSSLSAACFASSLAAACASEHASRPGDLASASSRSSASASDASAGASLHCSDDMALIPADATMPAYCIDRWEASLVEIIDGGAEQPFPFNAMPKERRVRAVSKKDVVPQGYISQLEAAAACAVAKKRMCTESEWVRACKGPKNTTYPYGAERRPGVCNDSGTNAMLRMPPSMRAMNMVNMNHPSLLTMPDTVAHTGAKEGCTNEYGVYDMVGNLHEWIAGGVPDSQQWGPHHAEAFCGGYFLDTTINGSGCEYKTTAHADWYHDYSTGFRCCADAKR